MRLILSALTSCALLAAQAAPPAKPDPLLALSEALEVLAAKQGAYAATVTDAQKRMASEIQAWDHIVETRQKAAEAACKANGGKELRMLPIDAGGGLTYQAWKCVEPAKPAPPKPPDAKP